MVGSSQQRMNQSICGSEVDGDDNNSSHRRSLSCLFLAQLFGGCLDCIQSFLCRTTDIVGTSTQVGGNASRVFRQCWAHNLLVGCCCTNLVRVVCATLCQCCGVACGSPPH